MAHVKRPRLILALAVLIMVGTVGPGAQARDQGEIGPMTPDNRHIEKEYPPLVGTYPNAERPACPPDDPAPCSVNPFAFYRPPACRDATYCDTIALRVEYPDEYLQENFFAIDVTLSWENPRTEDNPNGNDVDLFLWPDDDPTSGGPSSKCGSPKDNACDNLETETITITEPANTEKDEDTLPLLFTVVNETGVNSGYTLTFEWYEFTLDFGDFPEFEPPERQVTSSTSASQSSSTSAPNTSGPSLTGPEGVQGPQQGERKVVVPGPDGELVERDLPVLAAGQGIEPASQGGILTPITWAAIAAILLGSGAAFFVLHRRRRAAEGDIY